MDMQLGDIVKLFSAALAYAIVVLSVILKVPQILAVVRSSSAEGISLASVLIEAFVFTIAASWGISQGLDFKDYGENAIILAQLFFLTTLVSSFQRKAAVGAVGLFVLAVIGSALSLQVVPRWAHQWLLNVQSVFTILARLPQIYLNYKRKDTGQLSFTTFFLAFGGGCARLLTTFVNLSAAQGRSQILAAYMISSTLNGIIVAQITMYNGLPFLSKRHKKLPAPKAGGQPGAGRTGKPKDA